MQKNFPVLEINKKMIPLMLPQLISCPTYSPVSEIKEKNGGK